MEDKEVKEQEHHQEFEAEDEEVLVIIGRDKSSKTKIQIRSHDKDANAFISAAKQLSSGDLPPNKQLSTLFDTAQEKLQKVEDQQKDKSTEGGKQINEDLQKIVKDSKALFLEKNEDEQLQNILHLAKLASQEEMAASTVDSKKALGQITPLAKESATIANSIKGLVFLLASSKEFRLAIVDLLDVLHSIFKYSADDQISGEIVAALKTDVEHNNKKAEQSKDSAKKISDKVQEDFKEGKVVSKDKLTELEDKLIVVIRKIVKTKRYRKGIKNIFRLADHVKRLKEDTKKDEKEVKPTSHENSKKLKEASIAFIDHWTGKPTKPFTENAQKFLKLVHDDAEMKKIYEDLKDFILKTMRDSKVVQDDEYFADGRKIFERLFHKLRDEKAKDTELHKSGTATFEQAKELLHAFKEDESSQRLFNDWKSLQHDMFYDVTGAPSLKHLHHTLLDIKKMYVPLLQEHFQKIEFPHIEGTTEKADFNIKGLTLDPAGLVPEAVHVNIHYDMEVKLKSAAAEIGTAVITIETKNISQDIENLEFDVHVKPNKFNDKGKLSVHMSGLSFTIQWRAAYHEGKWKFNMEKTICHSKKLKLKVKSQKHGLLDPITLKLFGGMIKKKITHLIADAIQDKAAKLTEKLEAQANEEH